MAATSSQSTSSSTQPSLKDSLFSLEGSLQAEAQRQAEISRQKSESDRAEQAIQAAKNLRIFNANSLRYGRKEAKELIGKLPEHLTAAVKLGRDRIEVTPNLDISNPKQMNSFIKTINEYLKKEGLFACLVNNSQRVMGRELDEAETYRFEGPCYRTIHLGNDEWVSIVIGMRPVIEWENVPKLATGWRMWEERDEFSYSYDLKHARPTFDSIDWPGGLGIRKEKQEEPKGFYLFRQKR